MPTDPMTPQRLREIAQALRCVPTDNPRHKGPMKTIPLNDGYAALVEALRSALAGLKEG